MRMMAGSGLVKREIAKEERGFKGAPHLAQVLQICLVGLTSFDDDFREHKRNQYIPPCLSVN